MAASAMMRASSISVAASTASSFWREIIRRLLTDGGTNVYTIEKNGVRKMIYQTAWRVDGVVGGLAEISMEIPAEMPHHIRN